MKNKNWKNLIIVTLMIGLIFITSCSKEKNVKSEEFHLFKEEMSSNKKIGEIQIKFLRPSLYINFVTSETFKINDVKKVIDKLKPFINTNHMDEIASKYWEKDTKVSTVYISFYNGKIDKNDTRKNLVYSIYTEYYKTHVVDDNPLNIDAYSTWFIEVDGREYQLEDYLDGDY